eukprot:jgi/Pico_ML_1/54593/g489.t1
MMAHRIWFSERFEHDPQEIEHCTRDDEESIESSDVGSEGHGIVGVGPLAFSFAFRPPSAFKGAFPALFPPSFAGVRGEPTSSILVTSHVTSGMEWHPSSV